MTGTKEMIAGKLRKNAIAIWLGDDPAAILNLLRETGCADEAKLLAWVLACRAACGPNVLWQEARFDEPQLWATREFYYAPPLITRAALLRCVCGPNPATRERVTCPEVVVPIYDDGGDYNHPTACVCNGLGTIPAPFALDPRWLDSTVCDLARTIRGGAKCEHCDGKGQIGDVKKGGPFDHERFKKHVAHPPIGKIPCPYCLGRKVSEPRFDLMPILADMLQEQGINHPEILHHCYHDKIHSSGCWILSQILGEV